MFFAEINKINNSSQSILRYAWDDMTVTNFLEQLQKLGFSQSINREDLDWVLSLPGFSSSLQAIIDNIDESNVLTAEECNILETIKKDSELSQILSDNASLSFDCCDLTEAQEDMINFEEEFLERELDHEKRQLQLLEEEIELLE